MDIEISSSEQERTILIKAGFLLFHHWRTTMTAITANNKVKVWGMAVRAYSYPASIVPVVVGSAFAFYQTGLFNWSLFLLALVAGMLYHTGCNLINDYYDFKNGLDREDTFGGSGVLVEGSLSPREFMVGGYITLTLGTLIGLYFVKLFGLPMLLIGVAGFLGAVFYTSKPFSFKYVALGSPLVFLQMGVLMVLGGYLIQAGSLKWEVVWVSLPVALFVACILQANDHRDVAHDRESGIHTIAILAGQAGSRAYLYFLLFTPYITVIILAASGIASWTIALPLITLPLAIPIFKLHQEVREEASPKLADTPEMVAKLHLSFGLMLTIGVVAGRWVG